MRSDVIRGELDGNVNVAFAERFDADMWDASETASTKPFGFQACYPGPDVGGHCIPITPQFLTWASELRTEFLLVENAQRVNEWMPTVVVDRIKGTLADRGVDLDEASIVTLGVAYKPDVGDTRHSVCVGGQSAQRSPVVCAFAHYDNEPRPDQALDKRTPVEEVN